MTRDGRRLVSHAEGGKRVFELVATNALPAGLPPVREWTIYGIKSAHTDLGLHRSHYVQRKGTVRRLEVAKKLFGDDRRADSDPSAFRYVQEGWWGWFNYIADCGEAKTREDFGDLLRRRRLDIGLSLCGSTTHVFGYEELARSLYPLRDLRMKWQVKGKTSQMVDNPGVSPAVIDPFVEAGIENLTFWPNNWVPGRVDSGKSPNRIRIRFAAGTDHPPVFWWEAPSGNRLLVWSGSSYIGGGPFGLSTAFIDKPSHPFPKMAALPPADWRPDLQRMERATAETLAKLEKSVPYDVWLFPDYHDDEIPSTRLADAFAKWNEKWATPVFRTVGELDEPFDRMREKFADAIPVVRGDLTCAWDRALPAVAELLADKLAADRRLPIAEARATLASVTSGAAYPQADLAHGYEALLLNDEHSYGFSGYSGRRCYDTWAQHRDWIETAGRIAGVGVGVGVGGGTKGVDENRWYRINVNDRGEITSIYDKELKRELLEGVANKLFYTRDAYRTWSDPSTLGAKITQSVWLDPNEKRIVIENVIDSAEDLWNTHRFNRYGHYAFPFKVENPRFYSQLNGPVVDAHDGVTPHVQDTYSCIRDWCAVENGEFGIALVQPDAFVVENGELHTTNAYCRAGRPKNAHIYPHVFADGLQYHLDRPPSFRFRFVLTSYSGTWRDAHIPAFAARQVGALAADGEIASFVKADRPNVELVALKLAEDGNGLIVRFRETEGRATRAKVVQSLVKNARIERVTVLEEPRKDTASADGSVFFRPFEMVTLRLTGDLPSIRIAAAKEPWTGLLTRPRVFPGGKGGTTYLLWGTDGADDFDHYELYRDGQLLATVTNVVEDGILYRNARYEDKTAGKARHDYQIRSVYKDGRKGALQTAEGLDARTRASSVRKGPFGTLSTRYDGCQLASWNGRKTGGEVFFMQKRPPVGGEVHGGVPICWPWFGAPPKEGLPKHGLARYGRWRVVRHVGETGVVMEMVSTPETMRLWPHSFRLEATTELVSEDIMRITFTEENTGREPFSSAWGFHPYFAVSSAPDVALDGRRLPRPLVKEAFPSDGKAHVLKDLVTGRAFTLSCSDNREWLVWNPGVENTPLCETLDADEWKGFYCLEPCTRTPQPLGPGERRTHELNIRVN